MKNIDCVLPQLNAKILTNNSEFASLGDSVGNSSNASIENDQSSTVLLVLGGRSPKIGWLKDVSLNCSEIWAADSGGEICVKAGLLPKCLIGDFDSIGDKEKEWLTSRGAEIIQYPVEKDLTDYQLCLKIASQRGINNVYVTGGWGGRFDHAYSNLFSALFGMSFGVRVICLADEIESLFYVYSGESIEINFKEIPQAFSLIPLGSSSIVSIDGAKWNLSFSEITQKFPYAISNEAENHSIIINAHEGAIGVYVNNSG